MERPVLDQRARRRQRVRNVVQGVVLLGGMVVALAVVGWIVLGGGSLPWVLVIGGFLVAARPRVPTSWMLSMYGARPLPEGAAPELHHFVRLLGKRARLPKVPRLYYVASPLVNAFAVGRRDDAALALTDGMLRTLTARQLAGVVAHEISHIRSGDTSVMSLSDAIARLVQGLSYVGVLTVFMTLPLGVAGHPRLLVASIVLIALPTVVTLLQLGLSRSREYDADLEGVALTGDPEGLASALETLERADSQIWERTMVPRGRVPDPLLLRTHPPTTERARRLRKMVPAGSREQLGHELRIPPSGYPEVRRPLRLRAPGIRW